MNEDIGNLGKSAEGGRWEDGITPYQVFQSGSGGEKLYPGGGAAGHCAATLKPPDPGSGSRTGDDIVPADTS